MGEWEMGEWVGGWAMGWWVGIGWVGGWLGEWVMGGGMGNGWIDITRLQLWFWGVETGSASCSSNYAGLHEGPGGRKVAFGAQKISKTN